MPLLTAGEVADVCNGHLIEGDRPSATGPVARGRATTATSFSADSRTIEPGSAFVAIRGGHGYVAEALAAGAPFAVVERAEALPPGAPGVVVQDSIAALGLLADHVRHVLGVRVVGITGSTGKTLTKDLTAAALRPRYRVHATPRSFNAEIGVPLTILSCPDDAEVAVVELGARRTGDIAALTRLVRPDIGIITEIGFTHLEIFESRDAIAETKAELVGALPTGGLALLPAGDDFLHVLVSATSARVRTVGPGGHVRVLSVRLDDEGCPDARVAIPADGVVAVHLPLPGRALVQNAAFALAVAAELGVEPADAAHGMAALQPSSWRLEVHRAGARTIVNDAYNASPTSTAAALRTVCELAGAREVWAILAEMAELGPAARAEHERVGRLAAALGVARVIAVGEGAEGIAAGAGARAQTVPSSREAAETVAGEAPEDAVILVKGSRVAGLERVADTLQCRFAGERGAEPGEEP